MERLWRFLHVFLLLAAYSSCSIISEDADLSMLSSIGETKHGLTLLGGSDVAIDRLAARLSEIYAVDDLVVVTTVDALPSVEEDDDKEYVAVLFRRPPPDRTCLLTPPKLPERVGYEGPLKLRAMVTFVNKQLGLHRMPDGTLSNLGRVKQSLELGMFNGTGGTCRTVHAPSALEFFTAGVSVNRPLLVAGATDDWPAMTLWRDLDYLRTRYGSLDVHVKVSPDGEFEGCEDASRWKPAAIPQRVREQLESPDKVVVRPATLDIPLSELLDLLPTSKASLYVEYLSLTSQLSAILKDIRMPEFARFLDVDTINLWVGNGRTLGKLHFDPFENLLIMVEGTKTVTMFPPTHNEDLYEGHMREAFLHYDRSTGEFTRGEPTDSTAMVMSPVDILKPDLARYPLFADARIRAVTCTIREGEMLYLPAFWWHEVQSGPSRAGRNIAINMWFKPFFNKEFPCASCRPFLNPVYHDIALNPDLVEHLHGAGHDFGNTCGLGADCL